MGRGGEIMNHPGNLRYRRYILHCQPQYKKLTKNAEKQALRDHVYNWITEVEKGRFLCKSSSEGWVVAPDKKVKEKISQALREDWGDDAEKEPKKVRLPAKKGTRSCCAYVAFLKYWDPKQGGAAPP